MNGWVHPPPTLYKCVPVACPHKSFFTVLCALARPNVPKNMDFMKKIATDGKLDKFADKAGESLKLAIAL